MDKFFFFILTIALISCEQAVTTTSTIKSQNELQKKLEEAEQKIESTDSSDFYPIIEVRKE